MPSAIIGSAIPVFAVLEHVARAAVPLGLADISRELRMPASTVHRLLGTLEQAGFVTRYLGSSRFIAGSMPQHLCRALFNRFPVGAVAGLFLDAIARSARETVTLSVRMAMGALRIDVVGDATGLAEVAGPSELTPLHETLEGSAILSALPDADLVRYRRLAGTKVPGPRAAVWVRVRRGRSDGFVIAPIRGTGRSAVGLPVRSEGQVIAAIGIAGPVTDGGRGDGRLAEWLALRDGLEDAVARAAQK